MYGFLQLFLSSATKKLDYYANYTFFTFCVLLLLSDLKFVLITVTFLARMQAMAAICSSHTQNRSLSTVQTRHKYIYGDLSSGKKLTGK
jgi:hypothetical protein